MLAKDIKVGDELETTRGRLSMIGDIFLKKGDIVKVLAIDKSKNMTQILVAHSVHENIQKLWTSVRNYKKVTKCLTMPPVMPIRTLELYKINELAPEVQSKVMKLYLHRLGFGEVEFELVKQYLEINDYNFTKEGKTVILL